MFSYFRKGRHTKPSPERIQANKEKLFLYYIYALIFFSFFFYMIKLPFANLLIADIIIAASMAYYIFAFLLKDRVFTPVNHTIVLSFLCFLGAFVSTKIVNSIAENGYVVKFAIYLIALPLSLYMSGYSISNISRGKIFEAVLRAVAICGGLQTIYIFASIALGNTTHDEGGVYIVKLFDQLANKNFLGSYLLMTSTAQFILFAKKKNYLYVVGCVLAIAAALIIGARASFLYQCILMVVIYIFYFKKTTLDIVKAVAIGIGFIVIVFLAYNSGLLVEQFDRITQLKDTMDQTGEGLTAGSSRLVLWDFAIKKFMGAPVFGIGYGGFFFDADHNWLYGMYEPHDAFLQILSEGGLVGFILFGLLLYVGFRNANKDPYSLGVKFVLMGYIVNKSVDIIWVRGDGHVFWILFFLVALPYHKIEKTRRRIRNIEEHNG